MSTVFKTFFHFLSSGDWVVAVPDDSLILSRGTFHVKYFLHFFWKMFFDTFCRIVILGTCVPFRLEQDHLITGGYPPSNTFLKKFKKILNRTNVRFSFKFQYWDARAGAHAHAHAHMYAHAQAQAGAGAGRRARVGAHTRTRVYTTHPSVSLWNCKQWKRFHKYQSKKKALTCESAYSFDIIRQNPTFACRNVEWKRLLSTNIAKPPIKRFQLVSSVIIPERLKTA